MLEKKCYCGRRQTDGFFGDTCIFHLKLEKSNPNHTRYLGCFSDEVKYFLLDSQEEDIINFENFIFPISVDINLFTDFGENRILGKEKEINKKVSFNNCTFLEKVSFNNSTFKEEVVFNNSIFHKNADFRDTSFDKNSDFKNTRFLETAYFSNTKFHGQADFSKVKFSEEKQTLFDKTKFLANKNLSEEKKFEEPAAKFQNVIFPSPVVFRGCDLSYVSFLHSRVENVYFDECEFLVDRELKENGLFEKIFAIDASYILWDEKHIKKNLKKNKNIDKKEFKMIETLNRRFKKNFDEKKDYHMADDFYGGEMEMRLQYLEKENKQKKFSKRASYSILLLYKYLSDYNQNPIFSYKVDNTYSPEHERGILFSDPELGIDWGKYGDEKNFLLSEKDLRAEKFCNATKL